MLKSGQKIATLDPDFRWGDEGVPARKSGNALFGYVLFQERIIFSIDERAIRCII